MLGSMPHDPAMAATTASRERFHEAFNRQDVDAIVAVMTDDRVFENTSPPPDGDRHEGQAAVLACWEQLFRATFGGGDVFRVRDGRVAEKHASVNG